MKNIIEAGWENRSLLQDEKTQEAIRSVINQLDEGKLKSSRACRRRMASE